MFRALGVLQPLDVLVQAVLSRQLIRPREVIDTLMQHRSGHAIDFLSLFFTTDVVLERSDT